MNSKQFYDTIASRYRLFYADWPQTVRNEGTWLDDLLKQRRVRTVLDCTCGIGTQALGLAFQGYEVTASDFSPANLAEAQRAAQSFGVSVAWHLADVRYLDQAPIAGPFDAVIALGNSLSHLLTEQDLSRALRQIHDQARPGGMVVVGQRDWDAILQERPRFFFRQEHRDTPSHGSRTVLFDLWHYDDPGERLVDFEIFILEEAANGWTVEVFPLRYRMWRRRALIDLMEDAGLTNVSQVDHDWELRLVAQRAR